MTKRGTIQQIADQTGVNQKTVRRALEAAGLDAKAVTFEQALPVVRAIADADRVLGHAAAGRGDGGETGGVSPYAQAKAQAELERARKLQIQNARAEGKLIDREAVTETGVRIIVTARTALLSLGYRLAEKVAGKTDISEITGIIESEVRTVLGEIADEQQFIAALDREALE
jgi:hypothetical protein